MKKLVIILAALLLLTGCSMNRSGSDPDPGRQSVNARTSQEAGVADSQGKDTADSQEEVTKNPTEATDASQETARTETNQAASKEADWTLNVEDTVEVKVEDLKIIYSLSLQAVKQGGTTDLGQYKGTASLRMKADASGLSQEMVSVMGGAESELKASDVKIDLVGYDRETYDDFGLTDGEAPLSNLSEADGMALGSFTITGSGKLDLQSIAPHTNDSRKSSDSGTGEMPYKISVEGGQVSVSIPMLNLSDSFHGMITGTPRN